MGSARHAGNGAADQARPGFGKRLVAPFAFEAAPGETIYLGYRAPNRRATGAWPR